MKFLEKIFSIKNDNYHKVITIFCVKIKIKNIYKVINNLKCNVDHLMNINNQLNNNLFHIRKTQIENLENPIIHCNAFSLGNAGDNILVEALKDSININTLKNFNFVSQDVRQYLSDNDIYLINKSKGVIIGGGGLFLKDTNANNISGWQMPISAKQINDISVPIYIFGVGYNRFRNQEEFEPYFVENINTLVEKATFVGIRNNGSIKALQKYLRDDLKNKLVYHPCATTILSKLYDIRNYNNDEFIAVNCAFDRENLRFGKNKNNILNALAKSLKVFSNNYKIKYYIHCEQDKQFLDYLNNNNTPYETIYLNTSLTKHEFLKLYSTPKLVIGMRGHAQMIPFGCGTPILSIISHDKLRWFLEDINHLEWGIDVLSENFENELLEKAEYILNNENFVRKQILEEQNTLYKIINENLSKIVKTQAGVERERERERERESNKPISL